MFGNGILLVWQTLFRLGINFVSLSVRLMFRPRIAFDSFLILCEIGALQFCFYAGIILCCLFVDLICGIPFSEQQLLNSAVFSLHTLPGRAAFFGQIGGGLVSALLFTFLEGRSRKAPDFVTTTFVIHFIVVSIATAVPVESAWWLSFVVGWALSMVLAIWTSLRIELRTIDLGVALPAVLQK